uniref:Uncharacterized protein n=1 Tax=Arundo donax TaxID=35708 RepID=A0A0A8ZN87_ARUDO
MQTRGEDRSTSLFFTILVSCKGNNLRYNPNNLWKLPKVLYLQLYISSTVHTNILIMTDTRM